MNIHKSKAMSKSFTAKYNVVNLVYVEFHDSAESMINRERALKEWKRNWKIRLIVYDNPTWRDLSYEII
jgi:putative endonuclease